MSNNTLPNSLESEEQILGYILNGFNIEAVSDVNKDWFYHDKHKYLFNLMLELYSRNINIDFITVAQSIPSDILSKLGGITYIQQLDNAFLTKANIKYHVNTLRDTYNRRMLIKTYANASQDLYDNTKDIKKTISGIETTTNKIILDEGDHKTVYNSEDLMSSTLDDIKQQKERGGSIRGMSTGLDELDKYTNGFQRKDLVIVAARPSMGKTAVCLNIAEYMSRDKVVAFFSLEMGAEKIGTRILTALSMIQSSKIARGDINEKELKCLEKAAEKFKNNRLELIDQANINMTQIKAKSKMIKNKYGAIDVIFIDHLGLIAAAEKKKERYIEVGDITRQCKIMAKELNCTVVLLSQLSRACESRANKRPSLSDLRESGNIEQDADSVLLLYRDEYYTQDTEDRNTIEIGIGKNRDGKIGSLKLFCDLDIQLIANLENGRK